MPSTRLWQQIEGALVCACTLALVFSMPATLPWWACLLALFAPDLSFGAYLFGPKVGAFFYNLLHVYGFGMAVFTVGLTFSLPLATTLGLLWVAHAGLDRMLGYGLKTTEGFKHTHLGQI